jgi:hypothetical protein
LPIDEGLVEFRAVGGDDHEMPWHKLWITPPPKLESFRVQVIPPSYTGEASTTLPEGATQVRALLGSRLQITARASRAIESASWDAGPVPVSSSGRELRFEVAVQRAGSTTHRLSLTDRNHFENASALRLEVTGVADPPPAVTLGEPATDQFVTPNATVRVQASVRDDRKLREIALEYSVGRTPTSELPSNRPDVGVRATNGEDWQVEDLPHDGTREAVVRRDWPLSELLPAVGDRIALRIVAADHCDVGEPRFGRSATRTLTVVTAEAKVQEIAQRLDLLLRDLESLAARQSQTKDQTEELRVQAEKAGELRPQDRDSLKRVELDQRQIGSRLIASRPMGRGDDLTAQARELLAQLESNQLQDSATRERLTRIATGIEALNRETLPTLESTLGQIVKETLIANGKSLPEVSHSFSDVVARQGEVLATLTELIRDLAQWRDRRELAREVAELADTQEALNRDTSELAPQTLGKSVSQLPNQQQADVAKLADRQSRQAERIEQLRQRFAGQDSNLSGQEAQLQRGLVENLPHEEVVAEFDQRGLVAKAQEAAQKVAANNLGQAARTQLELADELNSLAQKLTQSPSAATGDRQPEPQELAKSIREFAAQQKVVVDETRVVAEAQQQAGKWTRPLSKEVLQLAEAEQRMTDDAEKLAELLSDIKALRFTAERAKSELSAAAARLREKQVDEETQRHEQAALRLLQSLAETLDPRQPSDSPMNPTGQPRAEPNKADEYGLPVSPVAILKLLRQIQVGVGEQTQIAEARQPKEPPNADEAVRRSQELRELAETQQAVRDATAEVLDHVPAPPEPPNKEETPRKATLSAMQESVQQLQAEKTGKATQEVQQSAVASLDALLKLWQERAALQQSLARSGKPAPMSDQQPGENSSTTDGSGGKPTGRDSTQARNSSDRERTGTDAEGELRRQRLLRESVWGHLPPALREKMLNLPHDKSLPKYSEHIRRYYEALAEQ